MLATPMATTWWQGRRPSPDVVDDVDERLIQGRSQDRRRQGEGRKAPPTRDEYGQGPKRAEAVARLLKIQPDIQITLESSPPKGRLLGQMQPYRLRPPPGATSVSGSRRRRCRSPKVDGGRLQKAAPEASLASKKDLLALPPH
jgi:hypothetical protein